MSGAGNEKNTWVYAKAIPWSVGIVAFVIAEVAMACVFFVRGGPANDAIPLIMMVGCFLTSPFCLAVGIAAGWFVRREIDRSRTENGASAARAIDCADPSDGSGIPW
jgi:hypothetical protein